MLLCSRISCSQRSVAGVFPCFQEVFLVGPRLRPSDKHKFVSGSWYIFLEAGGDVLALCVIFRARWIVFCMSWHLYAGSVARNSLISLAVLRTLHLSMKNGLKGMGVDISEDLLEQHHAAAIMIIVHNCVT